ncbi:MAG TPA: M28 family metallopeptidase [bacterium]|nr:M28 family metallopeptidase [bacterium]
MKPRAIRAQRTLARLATGIAAMVVAALLAAVPSGAEIQTAVLARVSGARAYQHVLALAQKIGPHVAGTPEDRTSGEYIAGQLTRDGYAVEWQPFPLSYFAVRAVSLAVPSLPGLALNPHVLQHSGSTPAGGVTAEVFAAALGRPEDFAGGAAAGKIALIERGGATFHAKAEAAAAAGAVAAVIYNAQPGEFIGTLGDSVKIAVVGLSGTEGQQLLAAARSGRVTMRLNVQAADEQRTTWNIIATKPGTRDSHRVLVVGAHRDTVEGAPGANDNTSGVAVVLELAEVLKSVPLGDTVRFVFFGAEEEGLYGSAYYVDHHGPDPIIGFVNLDMEGVGQRLMLSTYHGGDTLVRTAARLAGELGIAATASHDSGSDHLNFERIGVPVVFLLRPDDPDYDTPRDTVDRVDPALLEVSARLALAIVLDVAGPGH